MNYLTIFLQTEAATKATAGTDWNILIMFGLMFVVVYFLMIRPQQKRQKELNNFRNSLEKGSKVITAGGIYATVKQIDEKTNSVMVEIDNNVTIKVDKSMLMRDTSDIVQK